MQAGRGIGVGCSGRPPSRANLDRVRAPGQGQRGILIHYMQRAGRLDGSAHRRAPGTHVQLTAQETIVKLPEDLLALLREPSTCYLATSMADGSPQLTQTWVDTDRVLITIEADKISSPR